jgi:hypothetical protein
MSKSKLYYDRQSVGQSVLISGTHLGLATNFSHSLFHYFSTVSGLLMWDALSDEKSGLYFSVFAGHRQRSLSQISHSKCSACTESENQPFEGLANIYVVVSSHIDIDTHTPALLSVCPL